MEEKCLSSVDNNLILQHSSTHTLNKDFLLGQDLLLHQPSTSRTSMSLLQDEDFASSQHNFAEVLDDDDETTTSGVLETFDISSSNSLPTCSDATVQVAVDDGCSTDTIKLSQASDSTSSNNEFFNDAEVFVINDDDDDEDDETVGCISESIPSTSRIISRASSAENSQTNGVIVATGGNTIYLETPVVDEQHHPQILNLATQLEFSEKAGKPKRLSDEFLLAENSETQMNTDDIATEHSTVDDSLALSSKADKYSLNVADSTAVNNKKSEHCADSNVESQQERMSIRLKKMNINNCTTQKTNGGKVMALEIVPSMVDIESMDLIERRDFEREQRLTGGIILKSSSFGSNLIKSFIQEQQSSLHEKQRRADDEYPSSSSCISGRAVSSDSKCTYKDLTATPTSSRIYNSRLTKSTAKLNLCSTLSHTQQQQIQRSKAGTNAAKVTIQKPTTSSSISTSTATSSLDTQCATANATLGVVPAGVDIFSNSNSNDSLMGGSSTSTTASTNCQQENLEEDLKQPISAETDNENSCSRTTALHPQVGSASESSSAVFDDSQPSTSSARCQYALPAKSLRQVHASAQTIERYLSRSTTGTNTVGTMNTVDSSSGVGINLITGNRTRRRTDPSVISAFKVVNENTAEVAPIDNSDFNEDTWADCEENTSDLEEICTCQHSTSSSISSHGGSNTSLNETDDLDNSAVCGKENELSNYIQMVSLSEAEALHTPDCINASSSTNQQRKRKYNESRLIDTAINNSGGCITDANSRKRIAYDFTSTPRSSQNNLAIATTPSTQLTISTTGSPVGRRTPRSVIPTRDNPPPELQNWLSQFTRWSHAERLLAVDRLIEHCEPTQVRHMMKVIEPQFQRDFISLLPRELALQVLSFLEPKDLLRAAQTCRSWRFLCDDNLLWKEKCRKSQILSETRTDRPKRGRAGNMPPIASPWKAAYMRQHIIEMNWRSRPIRDPKVLKGHDDHVITCLQFSGNRIVSGSDDNTLKVWSAVTGRCLRTLVGHTGGVWSSQMSGNIIISGSTDRTLKVWDMETGTCVHTLLGHTSTVRCMHLHGNKVVSGSRDATLRVWDIEQGTCLHLLVGHLAAVRCVQYDGKLIVSGAYDYMVKVWHPERQECLHTLQGHTNRVYSLQFDGIYVVSGSLDTSIRVWDVETGNCKHTLMGHQSLTSGMELRDNILVSGNADSTVKVWDITTGQCLQTLSGPNKHQSAVTCLQSNSRFVVTSSDDGTVKLWDVKTGDFIRNLVALDSGGSGGVVWRIRANDTKLVCAVGSRNGTEETKLMVLDFDVEGACVKCS